MNRTLNATVLFLFYTTTIYILNATRIPFGRLTKRRGHSTGALGTTVGSVGTTPKTNLRMSSATHTGRCCHITTSKDQVSMASAWQGRSPTRPVPTIGFSSLQQLRAGCQGDRITRGYTNHGITYATRLRESCGTSTSLSSRRDACIRRALALSTSKHNHSSTAK